MRNDPTVVLACLHTLDLHISPRKDDVLWCARCDTYQPFVITVNYMIRCDDCNRIKKAGYGNAIITATTYATVHSLKYPGHTVHVKDGDAIVSSHKCDAPTLDDIPPF